MPSIEKGTLEAKQKLVKISMRRVLMSLVLRKRKAENVSSASITPLPSKSVVKSPPTTRCTRKGAPLPNDKLAVKPDQRSGHDGVDITGNQVGIARRGRPVACAGVDDDVRENGRRAFYVRRPYDNHSLDIETRAVGGVCRCHWRCTQRQGCGDADCP